MGFAQIVHPLHRQDVTELIPLHGTLSVLERGEAGDGESEQQRKKDRRFKVFCGPIQALRILLCVLSCFLMPSACRSVPGPGFCVPFVPDSSPGREALMLPIQHALLPLCDSEECLATTNIVAVMAPGVMG